MYIVKKFAQYCIFAPINNQRKNISIVCHGSAGDECYFGRSRVSSQSLYVMAVLVMNVISVVPGSHLSWWI